MRSEISNVYLFKTHHDAENAVRTLALASFDMKHLSIVGRGYHTEEHPLGFYSKGDRIRSWGKFGAFWGAIWGLLFVPAVFVLPGLGLVAMAGPLVSVLVSALEGAVVMAGMTALGAALLELSVDREKAIRYEVALKADQFLLMVHGSDQEIQSAHSLLGAPPKQLSYDHPLPDEDTRRPC
jgi:hypothetical protein